MSEPLINPTGKATAPRGWAWQLLPSLGDILFAAFLIWLFMLGDGWQGLLLDSDTGWHIRAGEWMLAHGQILRTDIFSLEKYGQPWFAWEWLAEVIYAKLHAAAGLKGVVLLSGLLVAGTGVVLFLDMMKRGSNLFIALALAVMALGVASIHFHARPHLFTLLLMAISLSLVAADRQKPSWRIWLVPVIAAAWANLHGGFAGLLVSLGLIAAGITVEGWTGGGGVRGGWLVGRRMWAVFALSTAATLINPFFYSLHLHVGRHLQASWIREIIIEFHSPKFRGETMFQLEMILLVGWAAAGLLLMRRRISEAILILFWAHSALVSVRHAPVFVIVAVPLIAVELTGFWKRWATGQPRGSVGRIVEDVSRDVSGNRLSMGLWTVVFIAVLAFSGVGSWPTELPRIAFPAALVDRHPEVFSSTGPWPRVFSSDRWGSYLIYRFHPSARVLLDGRADFYGEKAVREYQKASNGNKGWREEINRYRFDYALVPAAWPLAELLRADPGWKLIDEDALGHLYQRVKSGLMEPTDSAERIGRSLNGGSTGVMAEAVP